MNGEVARIDDLFDQPREGSVQPDWVIFGAPSPRGAGVMVFASSQLDSAQLRTVQRIITKATALGKLNLPEFEHTLQVKMPGYTLIYAGTYQQAMAELSEVFTPGAAGQDVQDKAQAGVSDETHLPFRARETPPALES